MTGTLPEHTERCDVVVVGGGAAGTGAAVGAALAGARTVLVERGPCLGGAATLRNVTTYCGLFRGSDSAQVVFGVAERVLAGLRAVGGVSAPRTGNAVFVTVDPEAVKRVLDDVCEAAGVDVLLHGTVVDAARDGTGRVERATVVHAGGTLRLEAAAFVDASGDAVLTTTADAGSRYGTDGRTQTATLGVRFGGVAADADTSQDSVARAVRAAVDAGVRPLTSSTGLVTRIPPSDDVVVYLADEDVDVRDPRGRSHAERHARRQAAAYLEALRAVPGWEHAHLASTGPELGIRESRHVLTRLALDREHVLAGRTGPTDVAVGAWPLEHHPGAGLPSTWDHIAGDGTFGVPLDALRADRSPNLFAAGRLLDGTGAASLRVMGTSFGTGHAAGVAAALAATGGPVTADRVRDGLDRQDARLPPR